MFGKLHIEIEIGFEHWNWVLGDLNIELVWNIEYNYSGLTKVNEVKGFQDLQIFPNPATSFINFKHSTLLEQNSSVQLIKADGTIVSYQKLEDLQLNVGQLSSGIYNVILLNGDVNFKGKFIKI